MYHVLVGMVTEFFSLQVRLSVQITGGFEWTMQIGGDKIGSDREPPSTLPQVLTTVSAVMRVIVGIDSLKFCPGNEDERYFPIQAARKGYSRIPQVKCCIQRLWSSNIALI